MNNLTPLQEVASRIYAAKIALTELTANGDSRINSHTPVEYSIHCLVDASITEAKALLEATKPEPLEWKPIVVVEDKYYISKSGEFQIEQVGDNWFGLVYLSGNPIHPFPTLYEAKQFAEHIRTR